MTDTICNESKSQIQGRTNLHCDIAFFSDTLARTKRMNIGNEEKLTLQQTGKLAQFGAGTLEMCVATACSASRTDQMFGAEAKALKKLVHEVALTGYLATHITRMHEESGPAGDHFETLYPALELNRKVLQFQTIFTGLGCRREQEQNHCLMQHSGLISALNSHQEGLSSKKNSKKILLVDDDPLIRKAVKRSLTSKDYQLKITVSGHEALTLLQEETFDVIVADFLIPGQDGYDLLRKVQERWPAMARIIFTPSFDNQRVQTCLENGTARDIIQKPWDNKHLYAVLDRATCGTATEP